MADHSHAVAGGGKQSHDHEVTDGEKHGHPKDNLLPVSTGKPFSEKHPAVVRMMMPEAIKFAEGKPFVAVRTGDWTWTDYGRVQITKDDLTLIKASFDENARKQALPIINEDHDRSRRIGTVAAVEWFGEDALRVVPDYNPVGSDLVKNDQYGYCSPELLFDYVDAETGAQHPAVLSGLALTNKPRMKSLGGIAASDGVRAAVMAFSEGPVTGATAQEAATKLMAEADTSQLSEDDDDPMPPCNWAPPFSDVGRCPAYTKVLIDGDGDAPGDQLGCCALAAICNGYSPTTQALPMAGSMYYSENRMPNPQPPETAPTAGVTAVADPPVADPVVTPDVPAPAVDAEATAKLDMAEKRATDLEAENTALKAENATIKAEAKDQGVRLADVEKRFNESEAQRAQERQATKLAQTKGRIDGLLAANKITPAEAASFSEDANLLVFSEAPAILDTMEARTVPAVALGELGTPGEDTIVDERAKMAGFVREFSEEKAKEGKKVDPAEAAAYAVNKIRGGK